MSGERGKCMKLRERERDLEGRKFGSVLEICSTDQWAGVVYVVDWQRHFSKVLNV